MNPNEGKKKNLQYLSTLFQFWCFCCKCKLPAAGIYRQSGTHANVPAVSVACRQIRQITHEKNITLGPNEAGHFFLLNSRRNNSIKTRRRSKFRKKNFISSLVRTFICLHSLQKDHVCNVSILHSWSVLPIKEVPKCCQASEPIHVYCAVVSRSEYFFHIEESIDNLKKGNHFHVISQMFMYGNAWQIKTNKNASTVVSLS